MSKVITMRKDSVRMLQEMTNEFMMNQSSQFGKDLSGEKVSSDTVFFALFKGDMTLFDGGNPQVLLDFLMKHSNELGNNNVKELEYSYATVFYKFGDLNPFVQHVGESFPYFITGKIIDSNMVIINKNYMYDVIHSKELKQLIKWKPNAEFLYEENIIDKKSVLSTDSDELPKIMYHGTSSFWALKILRNGIRPNPNGSSWKIKHDKTVFLAVSIKDAQKYAQKQAKSNYNVFSLPCVIHIDTSKIDKDKVVLDYDVYHLHSDNTADSVYNDAMDASSITRKDSTNLVDNDKLASKFSRIGYRGIIMPSAINSIDVYDESKKKWANIDTNKLEEFVEKVRQEVVANDGKFNWEETSMDENVDMDKYEIGGEMNAPIGSLYYHVKPKTVKISEDVANRLFLLKEGEDVFAMAIDRFGVTNDIRECGYVLPDGVMLDFSGRNFGSSEYGRRRVEHRAISDLNYLEDLDTESGLDVSMEKFIRMGAIRVHVSKSWSMINLFKQPTRQQSYVLAQLIRYSNGCVTVEIGDGDVSYCYGEYDYAKPTRVLGDINRYFDENIKFKGNVEESKKGNDVILEYLDKNYNYPLYKYFKWAEDASECELCEDIIYRCPETLKGFAKKVSGRYEDFIDYENLSYEESTDEATVESFIELLSKNKLCDSFKSVAQELVYAYEDLPSWYTCDFKRIVKNEWCIHFGNDAYSIAREGFTGGTEDIDSLAFTGAGQKKNGAGYDFAYSLVTLDRNIDFVERRAGGHKYGAEAVIFRTSGVEVFHYGDNECQVIFYGPYAKDFIPISYDDAEGTWIVRGNNDQVLKSGSPSEIAFWAEENLPQYKKQILMGKNGTMPRRYIYRDKKYEYSKNYKDYPFSEERMVWYLNSLMESNLNEEVVADGSSEHNPYANRWKIEREALKNFLRNNGTLMTSRENGKQYFVFADYTLSNMIGYNYCLCIQWDPLKQEVGSTPYIRALDKFTMRIFNAKFDSRGRDNMQGTYDDLA